MENLPNGVRGGGQQAAKAPSTAPAAPSSGQQAVCGVIIESERDQRTLDWLIEQAGAEAVQEAVGRLAGGRRPYPSNVARIMGLTPPESLAVASRETAQAHLAQIRAKFGFGR